MGTTYQYGHWAMCENQISFGKFLYWLCQTISGNHTPGSVMVSMFNPKTIFNPRRSPLTCTLWNKAASYTQTLNPHPLHLSSRHAILNICIWSKDRFSQIPYLLSDSKALEFLRFTCDAKWSKYSVKIKPIAETHKSCSGAFPLQSRHGGRLYLDPNLVTLWMTSSSEDLWARG